MNKSLASSPVVPIATAVVAAALIFGTLQTSSTASSPESEDTTPAVDVGVPAVAAPGVAQCAGKVCTITFPAEGGSVDVLGTTVTATKFYGDGITLTVAGTPLTSNLTTPAKGAGFTTKTISVENGAQSTHVVKVTQNKK